MTILTANNNEEIKNNLKTVAGIEMVPVVLDNLPQTDATYSVQVWGPASHGDEVGSKLTLATTLQIGRSVAYSGNEVTIQIHSDGWDCAYVTTWIEGGISAKYFPGSDKYGFGGDIPEDAKYIVKTLSDGLYDYWDIKDMAQIMDFLNKEVQEVSGTEKEGEVRYDLREILRVIAEERIESEKFVHRLCELALKHGGTDEDNGLAYELLLAFERGSKKPIMDDWTAGLWQDWRGKILAKTPELAVEEFTPYRVIEFLYEKQRWEDLYKTPCPPDRIEEEWYDDGYERGLEALLTSVRAV